MKKLGKLSTALTLGLGLALSSSIQAQSVPTSTSASPSTEGPYIGLGAGAAKFKLKKNDFLGDNSPRSFDQSDKSFKVFGGYRLNEHFALEAQFARLGESKVRYGDGAASAGTGKFKASAASLAAVGILPLSDNFSLFAKVGPAFVSAERSLSAATLGADGKKRRAGLLAGVGASYRLTENLSLRAELENYSRVGDAAKTGRSTVSVASAGLSFQF